MTTFRIIRPMAPSHVASIKAFVCLFVDCLLCQFVTLVISYSQSYVLGLTKIDGMIHNYRYTRTAGFTPADPLVLESGSPVFFLPTPNPTSCSRIRNVSDFQPPAPMAFSVPKRNTGKSLERPVKMLRGL